MADSKALFARRQRRARYALRKAANGRPRLSVFRSGKHIYAQVIVDLKGVTVAAASSLDETLKAWERAYIEAAMRLTRGNVSQAAKLLGVNRTTLYSRMSSGEGK